MITADKNNNLDENFYSYDSNFTGMSPFFLAYISTVKPVWVIFISIFVAHRFHNFGQTHCSLVIYDSELVTTALHSAF